MAEEKPYKMRATYKDGTVKTVSYSTKESATREARYEESFGARAYVWDTREEDEVSVSDYSSPGHAAACAIHSGGECSRFPGCLQDGK